MARFSESRWSAKTRNKITHAFDKQVNKRATMSPLRMACATDGCGSVPAGQRGQECEVCKRWPLCDQCMEQHQRGNHRL